MAGSDFIWRFTPSRTEPALLEEIFVQRGALLGDISERVRESALTGNKHQVLLIGPRGIGKTHLIALLHHRVTQTPDLSDRVRIAWLLEDETITSFAHLLKRIYELLGEDYPAEFPPDWLEVRLDLAPAKILKALESVLVAAFRDKMLLLLVENLDLIFEGLRDEGQKQWRSFLQTHPFTCIIATSQRLFTSVRSRDKPFFGFFAATHLEPLPAIDAVDLLRRIAGHREQRDLIAFLETPEGRSRVRALHHLAGGNHRIYIILSGFITRESLDELAGPFEKMADELTPYYQERMRWLSPQQRQIVEYLCGRENTCTPKEIARHLLASENSVSGQLKKLLELGYVLRNPRGRESLYELAEPLMRLASEVKEKRRKPLRLLVNFLRIWYRPDALPQLLAHAGTPSLRAHLQAAISQSQSGLDPRLRVLQAEIEKARQENRHEDLLQILEELAHTRGSSGDWFELAESHFKLEHFEPAVECLDAALDAHPNDLRALILKGLALGRLDRQEAAVECFEKALEIDPRRAAALDFKGSALITLGREVAAVESFDEALEIDLRRVSAWTGKGFALKKLGRGEAAIECFDKALEIDPQDNAAWIGKGHSLNKLGRYEVAIECFDKAIEIDPRRASAWTCKGYALNGLGRGDAAIECFDKAIEIDPRGRSAWTNKGFLLRSLGRHEAAVESCDKALEIEPEDAGVWSLKGFELNLLGRDEAAIKCFDRVIEINPQETAAWNNKGYLLNEVRRYDEAINCLDKAIEIDPQFAFAWNNKGHALSRLGRHADAGECYEWVLKLESDDPAWAFYRCESRFSLRQWEAGFSLLRDAFERNPQDSTHDVKSFIDLILRSGEGREGLRRHLAALIAVYAEAGVLTFLGHGLVRSLRRIDVGRLGVETLEDWRIAWPELGGVHAELEIPLRLFRVGIEYLIARDEKVLLDLVTIERTILRQALGLEPGGMS